MQILVAVKQLLGAIEENNESAFDELVSNLRPLFSEVTRVEDLVSRQEREIGEKQEYIQSLISSGIGQTASTTEKVEELTFAVEELTKQLSKTVSDNATLTEQLADSKTAVADLESRLNDPEKRAQVQELNKKISELRRELEYEKTKPDFSDEVSKLREEKEVLKKQLSTDRGAASFEITQQYQSKFEAIKTQMDKTLAEAREKDKKIRELLDEISKLRSVPQFSQDESKKLEERVKTLSMELEAAKSGDIKMPIIDQSIHLKCDNVVVFKEVKPAIYMNSLIEYVGYNYGTTNKRGDSYQMIVVLDPLTDENRVMKYKKHGFCINESFEGKKDAPPVLVTNLPQGKIREIVNISNYDGLLIIDRMGRKECAVNRVGADIYYSIDTDSDIIDFNLPRGKCVCYKKPSDVGRNVASVRPYFVDPSITMKSDLSPGYEIMCQMGTLDFVTEVLCHEF